MATWLLAPGVFRHFRQMRGSGVNTYRWVNSQGDGVLVKVHWNPKQTERKSDPGPKPTRSRQELQPRHPGSLPRPSSARVPEWEMNVQISRPRAIQLDFDLLTQPRSGRRNSSRIDSRQDGAHRNPENYYAEVDRLRSHRRAWSTDSSSQDDNCSGRTFPTRIRSVTGWQNYPAVADQRPETQVTRTSVMGEDLPRRQRSSGANPACQLRAEQPRRAAGGDAECASVRADDCRQASNATRSRTRTITSRLATLSHVRAWERDELISNLVGSCRRPSGHPGAHGVALQPVRPRVRPPRRRPAGIDQRPCRPSRWEPTRGAVTKILAPASLRSLPGGLQVRFLK